MTAAGFDADRLMFTLRLLCDNLTSILMLALICENLPIKSGSHSIVRMRVQGESQPKSGGTGNKIRENSPTGL